MISTTMKKLARNYSVIIAIFVATTLLWLMKQGMAGLSIVQKRLKTYQLSITTTVINPQTETTQDEIPQEDGVTDPIVPNRVSEGSLKSEEGDFSSSFEHLPPLFGRAQVVPNSIPFIVYDNKEQVEDAVVKEVCRL